MQKEQMKLTNGVVSVAINLNVNNSADLMVMLPMLQSYGLIKLVKNQ